MYNLNHFAEHQKLPDYCRSSSCYVIIPSDSVFAKLERSEFKKLFPNGIISDIPAENYYSVCLNNGRTCSLHTTPIPAEPTLEELIADAQALISEVNRYLSEVQTLPDTDRATLESLVQQLSDAVAAADASAISSYTEQLRYTYGIMKAAYPPPLGRE